MNAFWIILALKATLWSALFCGAVLAVPSQHPQLRRGLALLGLWGIWLVPWLPAPAVAQAWNAGSLSIPASIAENTSLGLPLLVVVWLVGSLILIARLLREAAGIARLLRDAKHSRLSTRVALDVRFSRDVEGPCMTGWWRPCVLLPPDAASWPQATLYAALRHEEQHARQHDGLHRLCAALLRALFWWNPAVHVLCGLYEGESEVCCDLEAASASASRREYGEMLLAHATGMPAHGLAMSFARRAGLRGRISRLLVAHRSPRWKKALRCALAVVLAGAATLLVAAVRIAPPAMPAAVDLRTEALLRLSADPFPGNP